MSFVVTPSSSAHHPDNLARYQQIAKSVFPTACEPWLPTWHVDEMGAPGWPEEEAFAYADREGVTSGHPCTLYLTGEIHMLPPPLICTVVVHEYGHLVGLQHSGSAPSLMAYSRPTVPYPLCDPNVKPRAFPKMKRKRRGAITSGPHRRSGSR